jgi:hypothetical protein
MLSIAMVFFVSGGFFTFTLFWDNNWLHSIGVWGALVLSLTIFFGQLQILHCNAHRQTISNSYGLGHEIKGGWGVFFGLEMRIEGWMDG